ncbi:hypothetical protein T8A63_19595 (plasmid) [Sulfitobacter sp. OXR-159]|uniref:phenylacetate--CoA ligase family protein n=1 Tax=Sulfitobacter sp. OXR-159 TaxID=3100174 RepID=UPI002AC92F35|nr:hypothetical protein [Sulfitobacter sp. OXR-159]WPZ31537.1 hypothetical protein T8A63_19595 [Sulfitobacter sp. OXR-159]
MTAKFRREIARGYFSCLDRKRGLFVNRALDRAVYNQTIPLDRLLADQESAAFAIAQYAWDEIDGYRSEFGRFDYKCFRQLPFLEKSLLIESPDAFTAKKPGTIFYGSTSGSTGKSLRFAYDAAHASWAEACKLRGRTWYNVHRGDPVLVLWGRSVRTPSAGRKVLDRTKAYLRNELYFNTFASLDEPFLSEVAAGIGYHQPKVIYGYGSSLAALGRYLFERSPLVAPSKERLLVQYTADHLGAADSKILEESLGSMVVSDYGASEAPGIAFECPEGHLHISVDCYKIEFLDQEGNEVPEGEIGDIVVTSLHNRAMPLIRYRIGDLGGPINGSCSCGNTMPRMRLAVGKSIDTINTSFVKGVSSHYLDYINIELMRRGDDGIAQFKVIQDGTDKFRLMVVARKKGSAVDLGNFIHLLRDKIGPVEVNTELVQEIPREASGKHRYFVSVVKE